MSSSASFSTFSDPSAPGGFYSNDRAGASAAIPSPPIITSSRGPTTGPATNFTSSSGELPEPADGVGAPRAFLLVPLCRYGKVPDR